MKKQLMFLAVALMVLCSSNIIAQHDGALQDFLLVNETGVVINSVYITPHDTEEWGDDILGKDVFNSDEETVISFDRNEDVCLWDLRIEDTDGNAIIWYDIDLCKWAEVTLHWDGETATAKFK
jgi:hypothetical protein